jgi:hypothetical protein
MFTNTQWDLAALMRLGWLGLSSQTLTGDEPLTLPHLQLSSVNYPHYGLLYSQIIAVLLTIN